MNKHKLKLKRMGVMNFTPNSFSDGGELNSPEKIIKRLQDFGPIDILDIGAESTAPMNMSLSSAEEWERFIPLLPLIKSTERLSIDSYHPETIFRLYEHIKRPFMWNDVSGKFDENVERFLALNTSNRYVFCHNLAPNRDFTGNHFEHESLQSGEDFLEEVVHYFKPFRRAQVVFDPCFGFSKNYDQNWYLLENFGQLQSKVDHSEWLLGISRKSFLRKKLGILEITPDTKRDLDFYHMELLNKLKNTMVGTVWIRTHRPELVE